MNANGFWIAVFLATFVSAAVEARVLNRRYQGISYKTVHKVISKSAKHHRQSSVVFATESRKCYAKYTAQRN